MSAAKPRLLELYTSTIVPELAQKFDIPKIKKGANAGKPNPMAIPGLEKIVVNMGVGKATQDKAILGAAEETLGRITGQKPVVTKAKVSVAAFRLREGNPIGVKVTLRGQRMYEFMDRLINLVLPRIRDFRGVNPNSFDGNGNYTLGLADQSVFPEVDADKIQHSLGMDITFVTSAKTDDQARELLRAFGMPFRKPAAKAGEPAAS